VPKEEVIEMEGTVQMVLPDTRYRVALENGHEPRSTGGGRATSIAVPVLPLD